MSDHAETLRRTRDAIKCSLEAAMASMGPHTLADYADALREYRRTIGALTAAIEAMDPEPGQPIGRVGCPACGARLEIEHGEESGLAATGEAPEPPQDTADLRAEVDRLAAGVYGDEVDTLVSNRIASVRVPDVDGCGVHPVCVTSAPDERTALLMLRGALRARLGR